MTHTCERKQLVFVPPIPVFSLLLASIFVCLKYQPLSFLMLLHLDRYAVTSALPPFQSHSVFQSVLGLTMMWPQVPIGTNIAWHSLFPFCHLAGNTYCSVNHILNVDGLTFRCEGFWWVTSQSAEKGKCCAWHLSLESWERTAEGLSTLHNCHSVLALMEIPEPPKGSPSCSSSYRVVGGVIWDCSLEKIHIFS